jgi:hypothetical protein
MTGRPSDYTEALAINICEQVAAAVPLVKICEQEGMPSVRTVYTWLNEKESFLHMYARAKEDQADHLASQILEIADNDELDANDKRVRVDARKWLASKFKPKNYGDRVDIGNADGKAFNITIAK